MDREMKPGTVSESYDGISSAYAEHIYGELEHKPLDRELLDRFAEQVGRTGIVCDIGCGPGHVSKYLAGRGVRVFGTDLSERMVDNARRLNPGIEFRQGDMASLDAEDGTWSGIVAFYSIIHIHPRDVMQVLGEFHRVLEPGGVILLSFHIGRETRHIEEMWGRAVSLDFHFFETWQMRRWLEESGFEIMNIVEREPYGEDVEVQTRRAYVFARKPAG